MVYYTCEEQDDKIVDKAIIIDFAKYPNYKKWAEDNYPSKGNELTPGYGKPKKQPKIRGHEKYDLQKKITPVQMNSIAEDLHQVLWGGGGTTDTEIFFSLVNIIFKYTLMEIVLKIPKKYLTA